MKDSLTEDEISILADIAYLVEKGSVFEKDYKLAKKIYEKCASFGNATALNNLGWLYQNGFGVKKDIEKAEEYFFQAAVRGNSLALVNLGNIYEFDEHKTGKADWKIARTWYLRGAMAGEDKAKMNYANALHYGYGGPKDRATAFFIFKELVGKVKGAYFYLGLYYENGFVVKKDVDKAIEYYKAGAIEDGDGYCFTHLGNILNSDKKNEYTDYENAAKCYLSAIQHEDLLGIVNIGSMYERGRVTGKKDLESALKWYQLGAQECEPNCIDMLEKHNVKKTSKLDYEISDLIEQLIEDFNELRRD